MSATLNAAVDVIKGLKSQDLDALMTQIQKVKEERRQNLVQVYGRTFSRIVGLDTLFNLPEVDAKDLGLDIDSKYYERIVRPAFLKDKSAVRGINGRACPFVAIKLEVLNRETRMVEDVVVEVIFKRYGNTGDGKLGGFHENNYVSTLSTITDEGTQHSSYLYSSGGMSHEEIQAVRDLLEGKEVDSPVRNRNRLRMVKV